MRVFKVLLLAVSVAIATHTTAHGFEDRGARPGDFTQYVLALSWSPAYCAQTDGRGDDALQCALPQRYGFIVHGLWPQRKESWPAFCRPADPQLPRRIIESMLDLTPSPGLLAYQWRKHGTCSALTPEVYAKTVRRAREGVEIPGMFSAPRVRGPARRMTPDAVRSAFMAANRGLKPNMMAVICRRGQLREVRVCLGKELGFEVCPQTVGDTCSRSSIAVMGTQ